MRKSNITEVPFNVIAIGASAGGLEALQDFLSHFPYIENTAILVAQHLSPSHKSLLVQLLAKATKVDVIEAEHGTFITGGKIYITPPDSEITIEDGAICLTKPSSKIGPKPSVDKLFASLAENHKGKLVAIILSGTGSDGALGILRIKEVGGYVLVQDPETAKYSGMPNAAILTGGADLITSPDKMGEAIAAYFSSSLQPPNSTDKKGLTNEDNGIAKILNHLSSKTGADFSKYKPATIRRRLFKRILQLGLNSIDEYVAMVEKSKEESVIMFNMILIGVTAFFRDKEAFAQIDLQLKQIIDSKNTGDNIRIWVPGCSSGEEPYSLAILINELLGEKRTHINVQIFATDIDDRAIAKARKGEYSEAALELVPTELLAKYFVHKAGHYELTKQIRAMVLFSRHDLTKNPPFLKLDMISCRNLLIYFSAALQQQVMPLFHYALHPNGVLFLGKSESIGQYADLFEIIDSKNKIYHRKRGSSLHTVKFSAYRPTQQTLPNSTPVAGKKEYSISEMVKETLFNSFEHPYVVINDAFDIQEINGDVRPYLTLPQGAVQVNLLKMINSDLQITLRSVLTKAIKASEVTTSNVVGFELFGQKQFVSIRVKPVLYSEKSGSLYLVIFEKVEEELFVKLGGQSDNLLLEDLRISELEAELAATKEHLQTYIEELETSNEELQSLNEEMQSTNEELQSSNEELETTNEELQSTNEEIQVAYAELKFSKDELERKEEQLKINEANVKALLNNNLQSFLLIDTNYQIVAFNNKAAQTYFELRNKKLVNGESIIDIIDPAELQSFIIEFNKAACGEIYTSEKQYVDTAGSIRTYAVNYTPVQYENGAPQGISLSMLEQTDLRTALKELKASEKLLHSVFDATTVGICITDAHGNFVRMNKQYCVMYGYAMGELIGKSFLTVVPSSYHEQAQQLHDDFINGGKEIPADWTVLKKDGTAMVVYVTAELLANANGEKFKVTSVSDVTERRSGQQKIESSEKSYRLLFEENPIPCFIVDIQSEQVMMANKSALVKYGYTEEDWQSMPFQYIIHGEMLNLKRIGNESADEHQSKRYSMRHKKKNGDLIDVELFGHPIEYNNRRCVMLLCNDVSERKEYEVKITKAIIKAQEDERFQMGAELHDNICQLLAYAQMNIGMLSKTIDGNSKKWYDNVSVSVKDALESVRNVSHQLAPAFIRDRPLKDALRMLLESFVSSGKFTFVYNYSNELNDMPMSMDQKLNLYRILQEQLRNIEKHSFATTISVNLMQEEQKVVMTIVDNGKGFEQKDMHAGIGFANMKRRAELFGGMLQVDSKPGGGCEVVATMKLKQ